MDKDEALAAAKAFDIEGSNLSLWVFKKPEPSRFRARAVNVAASLEAELRAVVAANLQRLTEVEEYQLLAETNEVSCLHLESDETYFSELKEAVDQPPQEHLVTNVKQLDNSVGYLIRMQSGNSVMYSVRKVEADWKTKKAKNVINVILNANELELVEDRTLTISKAIDFFVVDDQILVGRKAAFESVLSYKLTYEDSFAQLQQEPVFTEIFVDLAPLQQHVGQNAMHLRRMAAVKQKGHYADPNYIARLRQVSAAKGWGIQFDGAGRIVLTNETVRTVMQVLLNHRLFSELSLTDFDVPSASQVQ